MSATATDPNAGVEADAAKAPAAPAATVGWHQIPLVNLLPPEIIEGRRFRRTRKVLAGVLAGTVLLGALGAVVVQRSVDSARDRLSEATSEVSSLKQQQLKYSAVPALSAQIQAAGAARTAAMTQDVLWYRMFTDMDGARPNGLSSGSITVNLIGSDGTQTAPDPLSKAGIGNVTITGSAAAYDGVSAFIEALDTVTGLGSTELSDASTAQDGTVDYTVSSVVTDGALSHRYTGKGH